MITCGCPLRPVEGVSPKRHVLVETRTRLKRYRKGSYKMRVLVDCTLRSQQCLTRNGNQKGL